MAFSEKVVHFAVWPVHSRRLTRTGLYPEERQEPWFAKGLLRAILPCDYHRERLPVIAENTHSLHQFRGDIVVGTHEHSNLLARIGTRTTYVAEKLKR
jgi:hypothetical protein